MEWHPNVSVQGRLLLQRTLDALSETLEPGWRGDATRLKADLTIMLDYLAIGCVGIAPTSQYGSDFVLHEVLGCCPRDEHSRAPLAFQDGQGVTVCTVPVWPSILELAVGEGLTVEVLEKPAGPIPTLQWRHAHDE